MVVLIEDCKLVFIKLAMLTIALDFVLFTTVRYCYGTGVVIRLAATSLISFSAELSTIVMTIGFKLIKRSLVKLLIRSAFNFIVKLAELSS